jgi:hypothetical protein
VETAGTLERSTRAAQELSFEQQNFTAKFVDSYLDEFPNTSHAPSCARLLIDVDPKISSQLASSLAAAVRCPSQRSLGEVMGPFLSDRTGVRLAFVVLFACALHAGCSSGDTPGSGIDAGESLSVKTEALTLPPINANADTSLRQAFQYANDGTGSNLSVSSVTGAQQRSLIRFNQSAIATAVGTQSQYRAQIELKIAK